MSQRIWATVGLLTLWRLGCHVPLPGIDDWELVQFLISDRLVLLLYPDLLTGGGLSNLSVFSLGLLPYFVALSLVLLLSHLWRPWIVHRHAGKSGRAKLDRYTKIAALLMAIAQSLVLAPTLELFAGRAVVEPGLLPQVTIVASLTAGALIVIWLGEQITRCGVGNGILLIVGCGVAVKAPTAWVATVELSRTGVLPIEVMGAMLVSCLVVVAACVLLFRARRDVTVYFPCRTHPGKHSGGRSMRLRLSLGTELSFAPILAVAMLTMGLEALILAFSIVFGSVQDAWMIVWKILWGLYFVLLFGSALAVIFARFDPAAIADNLKAQEGVLPGIRPGKNTREYLRFLIWRLGTMEAICLAISCLLPDFLLLEMIHVPPTIGGAGLVIMTFVVLDLMPQLLYGGTPRNPGPPDIFGPAVGKRLGSYDWEEGDMEPSEPFSEGRSRRRAHARTP